MDLAQRLNAVNKIPFHGLRLDFESSVHWFLLIFDSFIDDVVSAEIWEALQLRALSQPATHPLCLTRLELWGGGGEYPQFSEDFDTDLHGLVELMTRNRPGSLPSVGTSAARHHLAVERKMVKVQAELPRMLEKAQQPGYEGRFVEC